MKRLCLIIAAAALAGGARADIPEAQSCVTAGREAEQLASLPANMLVSIGMVESGRVNPLTGRTAPWPWTVNADGQGEYFPTKQAAEAFVRFAEASGARDVDVGCFQISLQNHPDAFASLDDAFDPAQNAAYAARFLTQLRAQTGSWDAAIADYHSAEPDLGLPYEREVLARWQRMGDVPVGLGAAGGVEAADYIAPAPQIIRQSAAARSVHVYAMTSDTPPPHHPGLPRVIYGN